MFRMTGMTGVTGMWVGRELYVWSAHVMFCMVMMFTFLKTGNVFWCNGYGISGGEAKPKQQQAND